MICYVLCLQNAICLCYIWKNIKTNGVTYRSRCVAEDKVGASIIILPIRFSFCGRVIVSHYMPFVSQ